MNCKKCKYFNWYDLASEDGDMSPLDKTKIDRNHCGHFLCGDEKGACPILKSIWYKLWVKILWRVGYYPLDETIDKK